MGWQDQAREAARLFEQGDAAAAAAMIAEICENPELVDQDRMLMNVNLATIHDRLGHEDQVLAAYDRAIALSIKPYVFVQESHAAYLFQHGHRHDAVAIWEHLLSFEQLAEDRRAAIEHNLRIARST